MITKLGKLIREKVRAMNEVLLIEDEEALRNEIGKSYFMEENNMEESLFITPQGHQGFLAKNLFNEMGKIQRGALAYIEKNGGGPEGNHTHSDNHIFIVVDGEVKIILGEKSYIVKKDEMFIVDGMIPHSIWNNGENIAKVIKISVER